MMRMMVMLQMWIHGFNIDSLPTLVKWRPWKSSGKPGMSHDYKRSVNLRNSIKTTTTIDWKWFLVSQVEIFQHDNLARNLADSESYLDSRLTSELSKIRRPITGYKLPAQKLCDTRHAANARHDVPKKGTSKPLLIGSVSICVHQSSWIDGSITKLK